VPPRPKRAARGEPRERAAPPQDPLARAKAVALRYLAASPRTEAQVRARLARAELGARADVVVAWLLGLGYLDDAAFAAGRARTLVGPGRLGPRLAERRLVAAGIEPGRARAAVAAAVADAGAGGPGGEDALCRALAERRSGADPGRLDASARARLARFLLGRGFSGPVVARVLGLYEDG
jgi:regulatory protein